jgi:Domain of unknown function (DUF5658)
MTNMKSGEAMPYIHFFVYLQLLDLLTTLVGLKFGVGEASPFVRLLMQWGTTAGVAASKCIAIGLAGVCISTNKHHLIRWITYWYAGLVVWNLCTILIGAHN